MALCLFLAPEFRVLPPNPQTGKAALPLQPMHWLAQASRCCVSDCNYFILFFRMMQHDATGSSCKHHYSQLKLAPYSILQHNILQLFAIITIRIYIYQYIYIYINIYIYIYIYQYIYIYIYIYIYKL